MLAPFRVKITIIHSLTPESITYRNFVSNGDLYCKLKKPLCSPVSWHGEAIF